MTWLSSSLLCSAEQRRSLSLSDLLLGILNLVGHLTLVDLELDLALVLQLGQDHEGLVVLTVVDESAHLVDGFACLHGLLHLTNAQSIVHMLLGSVRHFLQVFEVDDCWLHVVGGLLLLQLDSHQLVLHLHELVWNHAELLVLRVVTASLWIEHHLHVHVRVDVVHVLAWESHLVLHHHSRELVHILHSVHASHRSRHLVVHTTILSHL